MSQIIDIHDKSVAKVRKAYEARKNDQMDKYMSFLKSGFRYEKKAALMLKDKHDKEPTRSVLFRSAASLAYELKDFKEVKTLVDIALEGKPHAEINNELMVLKEKATSEGSILGSSSKKQANIIKRIEEGEALTFMEVMQKAPIKKNVVKSRYNRFRKMVDNIAESSNSNSKGVKNQARLLRAISKKDRAKVNVTTNTPRKAKSTKVQGKKFNPVKLNKKESKSLA